MTLIDTHAHLFAEEFEKDLQDVIVRAKEAGVEKVLLPNIDENSIPRLQQSISEQPGFFYPMMGLHPTSVGSNARQQLEIVYRELHSGNYVAVGEIGIDLYWDSSMREAQVNAFEEQLKWSIEKDLPVSIHFRNATEEVIKSIQRVGAPLLRGVFHSFGGNRAELEAIMTTGDFFIGVNGVVTFKNSGLSETLQFCPTDRLLLETDSPYLAPVPYRGKRSEPAFLSHIVKQIARIWDVTEASVAQITSRNALKLFTGVG